MGRLTREHLSGGPDRRSRDAGASIASRQARGLAACHDLALATGRMATWEHNRSVTPVRWRGSLTLVLGADLASFHLPDNRPCPDLGEWLVAPVITVVEGGGPWDDYELERVILDREGRERTLLVRARPVFGAGGTISGSVGVVVDISADKEAAQALQEQTDRYRLLLELSPDGIVVHEDGVIRWANQAAADFVGVDDLNEHLGESLTQFIHPDSLLETLERIASLKEDEAATKPAEATLVRVDGSNIVVESLSVRTKWDGRPAYQVILRDLSLRRKAEEAMRYQAKLVEHVSDAIIGLDPEGRIDSWNPAAEEMYGWTRDAVIGRKFADVVGADPRLGLESTKHLESVHRRSDGTLLEVRISVALVLDQDHHVTGAVAVCADITERRRSEAARRALEERYTAVVASLEEGIVVSDDQGVITAANRAAESILGRRIMVGERIDDVFSNELHARHPDGFLITDDEHPTVRTLRTGESFTNVLIGIELADREPRWLSLNSRPLRHDDLLPYGMVCSFSDVTERRRTERQLNYQATHDALTGLANRAVFIENLRQTLDHARRGGSRVGVLFIDLDRFKGVNDTQGHLVGDEVLGAIARRLLHTTRSVDTVARLSGDEFVVLCPDLADIESARRRATEIAAVIAAPIPVSSGRDVVITASVGVSCVESGLADPEAMLRDADVAMYTAKERGRARVELLDHTLRERAQRRTEIERDLRLALDNDELAVHYQPIVGCGTDGVIGLEALARWPHPSGPITPDEFIPIAEESGLILPLGIWVLNRACAEAAHWKSTVPAAADLHISVNLSGRQLGDPDVVANISAALSRSGLEPDALWLEITESTLMDDAAGAARTLNAIRELGVHLVIDDFGTGYSSLAYLKRFPVDTLKIDRSFVDGLGRDAESEAIVRAVVGLTESLHLSVIAEGVETLDQLATLHRLGCDTYQGYLFAKPMAADEISFDLVVPDLDDPDRSEASREAATS
jgi:diguanylate cyclase (GGDEF)-like protein/PAS domain S-box-containing protein